MTKPLCVLAFSGGLDTSYCALHIRKDLGYDVLTAFVDTGGGDGDEAGKIEARARELGAVDHVTIDATQDYYDRILMHLIRANALRGNVYPLAVGAERVVQGIAVCKLALERKANAIAHGSTSAGNDQMRFDLAVRVLAPRCRLLTPIRDEGIDRATSTKYLVDAGFDVPAKTTKYSINKGLWGTSIGGGDTHDAWLGLPEEAYVESVSPAKAPDEPDEIVIGFEAGLPISLNGEKLDGVSLIRRVAAAGHKHGVGRGMHLGTTILGFKGRVAFEAPAPAILIAAHRELEKLVQTRQQGQLSVQLSEVYANGIHEGRYFDPALRDVEAFFASSQQRVTGEAKVRLFKGSAMVVGVRSPHSLLGAGATYGEAAKAYTGPEAAAFCKIAALEAMAFAEKSR